MKRAWLGPAAALFVLAFAGRVEAGDKQADPSTYKAVVPTLAPGDTLTLAAGTYGTLSIANLNGSDAAWITIRGPTSGPAAVFVADPGPCCNTVEISGSSYVALEHVTIDGAHVDGAFGISAKQGVVHHIRVEGVDLINHDGSQQHDAISTKVPTWGWVIRNNRIINAGTGLYLGNSDGSDPFIGGVIENNLVQNPIGYCMEIKWQLPRPDPASVPGIPQGVSTTIIRNNVFIKGDGPSPDGDRPNVLVGGFPASGAGAQDRYEIYGNLFFHNPRESLLQASGRVTIHDNIFVDAAESAVNLRDHDLPLRLAYVYDNTVYQAATGVNFGNAAPDGDAVAGNLLFAVAPINGPIADNRDNIVDQVAGAAALVNAPSVKLGEMDFYPLAGKCKGSPIDASKFAADTDHDLDFNGKSRGNFTFRGAYAGEGKNPGWQLGPENKPPAQGGGGGAGQGGGASGAASGAGGASGSTGAGASSGGGDAGGCGCRTASAGDRSPFALSAALLAALGAATRSGYRRRARRGGARGGAARCPGSSAQRWSLP